MLISSLGSTRFLKVCRAKQTNGLLVVVKVFVLHDHTLPIQVYCERLVHLRRSLSSSPSPNCLAFTQVKVSVDSQTLVKSSTFFGNADNLNEPFLYRRPQSDQ